MNSKYEMPKFIEEFERFLAEYRQNRAADASETLNDTDEYEKMVRLQQDIEDALYHQGNIDIPRIIALHKQYIRSVVNTIDKSKDIFYEHGFKDSFDILNGLREVFDMQMRTLADIDIK